MAADPEVKTFNRIRLAFRRWAGHLTPGVVPEVAGADPSELSFLAALGGLAAEIGGDHLDRWPEPCRLWARSGPTPPAELVEEVGIELGAHADVLAALYNACISAKSRRRLGTVFTPRAVVDHMVGLVDAELPEGPSVVLDPGAGVGAFSISAARRWPSARAVAIDINPVTLGLLATRLAFEIDANPEDASIYENIELRIGSYLDLFGEVYERADGPVAALGNPPYTRIQQMPTADRRLALELSANVIDSGHANLATLIQAMTLERMGPHDVSCMILPGSFGFTRAARGLRRAFWGSGRPLTVERWPAAQRLFVGHSVQAAIVCAGQAREDPGPLRLSTVELKSGSVRESASGTAPRAGEEPSDWLTLAEGSAVEDSVALGSLAKVRRGVATGANQMFFLDDLTARRLPEDSYVAGVASLRGFDGTDLDAKSHQGLGGAGGRRWLLAISADAKLEGELKRYVDSFEVEVKDRHLPSKRPVWYSLSLPAPPALLVSPLSKGEFRIVANQIGAIPSNNLFGIYPTGDDELRRITEWLRSTAGQEELRRVSRRYPGGSYKLEPAALASVRIPRSA
jgi:adenine-specific DNA-methyltransferase